MLAKKRRRRVRRAARHLRLRHPRRRLSAGSRLLAGRRSRQHCRRPLPFGRTSELVLAVRDIRLSWAARDLLSAQRGSDLAPVSQLDIVLDWCYDQSVCQTRTVTNFYAAILLLAAVYSR